MHFFNLPVCLACFFACFSIWAEQIKPIKFGMSAPLTGPAKQLGISYRDGANQAFSEYNTTRLPSAAALELVVLDDGYEPLRTVANTKQFLLENSVFALFGYVGTSTATAALPLLRKYQKPFIAPLTGSDLLRQPDDKFIINFRSGYRDEITTQFQLLVDQLGYKRVALFIQADEFGASVEQNILEQFAKRQLAPMYTARFQRNSADIYDNLTKLQNLKPDLVITVGTYSAISEAINWSAEQGFNPAYSILSFTGSVKLASLLEGKHQVFASAVLPWPSLSLNAPKGADDIYIEGYQAGSLVVAAVKACEKPITSKCLMKKLSRINGYSNDKKTDSTDSVLILKLTDGSFTQVE